MDTQTFRDFYQLRPGSAASMPFGDWVSGALGLSFNTIKGETNVNVVCRFLVEQELNMWDCVGFSYPNAFNAFNKKLEKEEE